MIAKSFMAVTARHARCAFTLVEMLISIAVLALLVTESLAGTRRKEKWSGR